LSDDAKTPHNHGTIRDHRIVEEMKDSYLTFAMSVIVSRALPDVRDGLKPSQRRLMVSMNDLNLGPRSKTRKCAKIVGDAHGNYHPHGDLAMYQTLARLAQDWVLGYPLVDGQGNFGSIDGDPPAAARYTEARMTSASAQMLDDLNYDTVDFVPNYDGTREEPSVLPGRFPCLLCNGSTGIAVGMATNIPPQNCGEVCDAIIKLIENPDATIEDLMQHIQGPDFPTGGIIHGRTGILNAYKTGKGSIRIRGRHHIEQTRTGRDMIVFTEIPYSNNPDKILTKIADLVKTGVITGISDLRNESDRNGMRLVITLKKGEQNEIILNQLFKHTQLQDTFGANVIALDHGQPKVMTLKDMLRHYVDHRREVVTRRTEFLLARAQDRAHILEGLLIALDHIDEVISIIRSSKTVEIAGQRLMERFDLSERQTKAILDMRLARLTGLERSKIEDELAGLRERIAQYEAILADIDLLMDVIREETLEIKDKFGIKRRTDITHSVDDINIEDLITEENMVVTISHSGYVKRQPVTTYRRQRHGGKGITGADHKEGDFTEHLFVASTHDYILFFTDHGRIYWLKVYDIPELGRLSKGRALVNLLQFQEGEKITSFIPVRDFSQGDLLMATEKGVIKRTALSAYSNPKKKGIIAIRLDDDDRLIGVRTVFEGQQILLATRNGMAIRFEESKLRALGRVSRGVRGINLAKDDVVVGCILAEEGATVLTLCENGYGKRTAIEEYRLTNRGGKGVTNIKATKRNGKVVACLEVTDEDEVMFMTQGGMIIRTPVNTVRVIGRATQGVRLVNVKDNDTVVALARVPKDENEDEESAEAETGEVAEETPATEAETE
jgi:DNA gyrase subunit A